MKTKLKIGDIINVEWIGGRIVACKITNEKNDSYEVTPLDYLSYEQTSTMRCWVKKTRIIPVSQ